MNTTCRCGKEADWFMLVDNKNVYDAKFQSIKEEVPVCDYHAEKARKLGIQVVPIKDIMCLGCGVPHAFNMTTRKVECPKESEYLEQHLIAEDEEGNTHILY